MDKLEKVLSYSGTMSIILSMIPYAEQPLFYVTSKLIFFSAESSKRRIAPLFNFDNWFSPMFRKRLCLIDVKKLREIKEQMKKCIRCREYYKSPGMKLCSVCEKN
jgi:hypothetical protein